MSIQENIAAVRRQIDEAALRAGRNPAEITLEAATKVQTSETIRAAIAAGITVCGENRVQEFNAHWADNAYQGAKVHFIGHLQKNKVKNVVGLASLIHSIDSPGLMAEIDRAAAKRGIVQDILLEVNIGAEENKAGFAPEEIGAALSAAAAFPALRVRGLMCVPPICSLPEENLPYFRIMKQLFIDNSEKKYDNVCMDFLSMGMSGDYTAAISCGANIVRIGTAIFGKRVYPAP